MKNTYAHAKLGRTGLGNLLFAWARAEVFAQTHSLPMIAPQWTTPKLGPLLRGETDLRYYTNLFTSKGYIRGLSKLIKLKTIPAYDANQTHLSELVKNIPAEAQGKVVQFSGHEGWFRDDLPPHRELVRDRLNAITSEAVQQQMNAFDLPLELAVHIRRGDFTMLKAGEGFGDRTNAGESEEYFLSAIRDAREVLGKDTPVTVFSNGKPGELAQIEALPGVQFAPGHHTALTDMLLMSKAKAFITSSSSSFSHWASFLGGMPTVFQTTWVRSYVVDQPSRAIEVGPTGELSEKAKEALFRYTSS